MERGRIQGLPKFLEYPPIISGTGKATNFKFCTHILRSEQKSITNFWKSSRVRSEDSQNFSVHPYIGRIARSSLHSSAVLLFTGRDAAITMNIQCTLGVAFKK